MWLAWTRAEAGEHDRALARNGKYDRLMGLTTTMLRWWSRTKTTEPHLRLAMMMGATAKVEIKENGRS